MSVLGQRFLFGTILLTSACGLLAVDHWTGGTVGFFVLCFIFLVGGWVEYARMVGVRDALSVTAGAAILGGGFVLEWQYLTGGLSETWLAGHHGTLLIVIPMLLPAALILRAFRRTPSREQFNSVALLSLGLLYIWFPLVCLVRLRVADHGLLWMFMVILLVKGNDIGAFLTGRFFGRTKLSRISPKKTWEGAVGGLLLGIGVALAFEHWGPTLDGKGVALLVGVVGGIAGQIGDLAESYLKRSFEIKDSGALVPAFGGALDIMDSVLFAGPVLYLLQEIVG